MTFNYCGAGCAGGSFPSNTHVFAFLDQIDAFKPRAILVSEICESQANDIVTRSQSDSRTWPLKVLFTPIGANGSATRPGCPLGNDEGFGNAIFIPESKSFGTVSVLKLTADETGTPDQPGAKHPQTITCADVDSFAYPAVVCNTHIAPSNTPTKPNLIATQIQTATDFAYGHAGGKALIFGGDMNAVPNSAALSGVYSSGTPAGTGHFEEIDNCHPNARRVPAPGDSDYSRCNVPTHGFGAGDNPKKIDYIFLKKGYFKGDNDVDDFSSTVISMPGSDHRLLQGSVNICDGSPGC
ncbi:endonuclease/exonuclease/phosphatase family protein [Nocardioides hankookensis]|uniref:Endonuclease/exonuclease/phosphatase family protein n=1 Tax=Nocardioides hankookensis TaxID=443157 RepID=A0ABW1LHW5_9ACTN